MKICSYSIVLQKVIFIYFLFALIEERKWEASKERRTTKVFCFLRLFRYPLISFPATDRQTCQNTNKRGKTQKLLSAHNSKELSQSMSHKSKW